MIQLILVASFNNPSNLIYKKKKISKKFDFKYKQKSTNYNLFNPFIPKIFFFFQFQLTFNTNIKLRGHVYCSL